MFRRKKDDYDKAIKMLRESRKAGDSFLLYVDHDEDDTHSFIVAHLPSQSILSMTMYLIERVNGLKVGIQMYLSDTRH